MTDDTLLSATDPPLPDQSPVLVSLSSVDVYEAIRVALDEAVTSRFDRLQRFLDTQVSVRPVALPPRRWTGWLVALGRRLRWWSGRGFVRLARNLAREEELARVIASRDETVGSLQDDALTYRTRIAELESTVQIHEREIKLLTELYERERARVRVRNTRLPVEQGANAMLPKNA